MVTARSCHQCASLAALVMLTGCGASAAPTPTPTPATGTRAAPATAPHTNLPAPAPARPRVSPGSLPQTARRPSTGDSRFQAAMAALWQGIDSGTSATALPAFFPAGAYVQLKAVGDPRADFTDRLLRDYQLDIAAAHSLVGAGARLVAVRVPADYAHWVPPGACYNRVGYYEVPNARIVYSQNWQTRSLGIASMISWRGDWYVVHLGAVVRSAAGGVVDDPQTGAGTSVPSSTC